MKHRNPLFFLLVHFAACSGSSGGSASDASGDGTGTASPACTDPETAGFRRVDLPNDGIADRVELADVDGDGHLDILAFASFGVGLTVFPSDGAGGFRAPITDAVTCTAPNCVTGSFRVITDFVRTGDLDGDGRLDLVLREESWGRDSEDRFHILMGDGAGRFNELGDGFVPGHHAAGFDLVDANGDGVLDLLTSYEETPESAAALAATSDPPACDYSIYEDPCTPPTVCRGTDQFGDACLPAPEPNVWIHAGTGNGTFVSGERVSVGRPLEFLHAVDFDDDGRLDFLGYDMLAQHLYKGAAGGSTTAIFEDLWGSETAAAARDVDGDGRLDVFVAGSVYFGNGSSGFSEPVPVGAPFGGDYAVGDADGDGLSTLAMINYVRPTETWQLVIDKQPAPRRFEESRRLCVPFSAFLSAADLNDDGADDFVLSFNSDDGDDRAAITVLYGAP